MVSDAEEVKKVIQGIFEAAREKDFQKLASYNRWDAGYTKFNDAPPFELLEGERARHLDEVTYTNITDFTCVVEGLRVDARGDCAVATCYLRYGGIFVNDYSFEATRMSMLSRATFVLYRFKEGWMVVHQHLSPMQKGGEVFGDE